MAVAMSPPRTFAARPPPLALGPLPDLDDLEVLELEPDRDDLEDDIDSEGIVVFNIGTPRGGSKTAAACHFAIGTPGSSPCDSPPASAGGTCCPTPIEGVFGSSCGSPVGLKVWGIERGVQQPAAPLAPSAERGRSRAASGAFGKAPPGRGALSSGSTRSRSGSSSDCSSRDPSPARVVCFTRGAAPLPEELLQAVLKKYDRSRRSGDSDFEIDSVSASECGSDDEL